MQLISITKKAHNRGWTIQKIINCYFEIDYQKLMNEKEEMFKELMSERTK